MSTAIGIVSLICFSLVVIGLISADDNVTADRRTQAGQLAALLLISAAICFK